MSDEPASLPIVFHPDARADALEAHDWYKERSLLAAEAFQIELENALSAIQISPGSRAAFRFGTRRYLLQRFPYVVVYRIAKQRIEIVAVAHSSRRPGYWKDRIPK